MGFMLNVFLQWLNIGIEISHICTSSLYRGWYSDTLESFRTKNASLHVVPPYSFAGSHIYAQTAASPLVDPVTQTYIGQAGIDFLSQPIFDSLNANNTELAEGGFPILITAGYDSRRADTVIGPGFSGTEQSKPIGEFVLANDHECKSEGCDQHLVDFQKLVHTMKAGESGVETFLRTTSDGSVEKIHIAFAPVVINTQRPVDSSNFSRGVAQTDQIVYSLALTEPQATLLESFTASEDKIRMNIIISDIILASVIVFATVFVLYLSHRITISITEPMLYLLELIRHINM